MGVNPKRSTPTWMVYFMENPIKMDDLGVPLFWGYQMFFRLTIAGTRQKRIHGTSLVYLARKDPIKNQLNVDPR